MSTKSLGQKIRRSTHLTQMCSQCWKMYRTRPETIKTDTPMEVGQDPRFMDKQFCGPPDFSDQCGVGDDILFGTRIRWWQQCHNLTHRSRAKPGDETGSLCFQGSLLFHTDLPKLFRDYLSANYPLELLEKSWLEVCALGLEWVLVSACEVFMPMRLARKSTRKLGG